MSAPQIASDEVAWLVEELAEASLDSVELLLACDPDDADWAAHVDYLQHLHRISQAVLARI